MPVTQRDQDIMQLESQLRIRKLLEEWQQGFMGDSIPKEQIEEEIDGTRGRRETEKNQSS